MGTIRQRNGKFQVQIRGNNRLVASKSFHKIADARYWARQAEVNADKGELESVKADLKKYTLADIVTRYLNEIVPLKKQSVETFFLDAFLKHSICSKCLIHLTPADFASYRDERHKTITPNSLKRQLAPVSHAFEIARTEWGIPIKENPVEGLRLKARDNRRQRRLRDGKHEKLLEAARTRQSPYIEWMVIFAIETAMRRREILGLPLGPDALQTSLSDHPRIKERLFTYHSPDTHSCCTVARHLERSWPFGHQQKTTRAISITANALRMAWERLLKPTDNEDLPYHDLRHEAISRFFEMGLTVPEVASINGHRDMKMLMRYAHARFESVQTKFRMAFC